MKLGENINRRAVPAFMGSSVDHIYQHCPLMTRYLGNRTVTGPDGPAIGDPCRGLVDPLGAFICGWCAGLWRRRHPSEVGSDE